MFPFPFFHFFCFFGNEHNERGMNFLSPTQTSFLIKTDSFSQVLIPKWFSHYKSRKSIELYAVRRSVLLLLLTLLRINLKKGEPFRIAPFFSYFQFDFFSILPQPEDFPPHLWPQNRHKNKQSGSRFSIPKSTNKLSLSPSSRPMKTLATPIHLNDDKI